MNRTETGSRVQLDEPVICERLGAFIGRAAGKSKVRITRFERMSGGAVQENRALDVEIDGQAHQWVLRTDAPAAVRESLTRAQEFAVLRAIQEAQVRAPRPLYLCEEVAVIGRCFFIMERLPGVAAGHRVTRDRSLVPDPAHLARELAANLARLHRITPAHSTLAFLRTTHARDNIAHYRSYLDGHPDAHPVLEWGLRWCEVHAPATEETTFIHRDYRTGNYLVHDGALAGLLDWEFSAFGNPLEDVGWLCARCWRFARPDLAVGGIAPIEDFLPEYERLSGRRVTGYDLRYWQVMAHLRWAVIALQQAQRHLSGTEPSLELALTGHILSDLEREILTLTSAHDQ
ncbi:MAG: phosphotransferase family protein [Betaproteobacteria bacterium]